MHRFRELLIESPDSNPITHGANTDYIDSEPDGVGKQRIEPVASQTNVDDDDDDQDFDEAAGRNSESSFNSFQFWKNPLPEIEVYAELLDSREATHKNEQGSYASSLIPELRVTDIERPDEVLYLSKQLSETTLDFDIEEEVSLNSSETLAENSMQDHERILAQVSGWLSVFFST